MSERHEYTCDWCGREAPAKWDHNGEEYVPPKGWTTANTYDTPTPPETCPDNRSYETEDVCPRCAYERKVHLDKAAREIRERCKKEGVLP